jgi:protein SCO1
MKIFWVNVLLVLWVCSCSNKKEALPILGERDTFSKIINGKTVVDTIYHSIPKFQFTNQNNETVTNSSFEGKQIYVADFFFTTCPTICPKMKTQMLKLYEHFKGNNKVGFLSHSIDPSHDTVDLLKSYSQKLGINGSQWHFVTGEKEKIYEVCLKGYMTTAQEDSTAEGGFVHSGAFILVDKQQHVRGIYDGTKPEEVDLLQKDMELLLKELEN